MERVQVDLGKEWLTVADICDYLGLSPYIVTRLLRSRQLIGVKIGREWRVARVDFEEWLNRRRVAAVDE